MIENQRKRFEQNEFSQLVENYLRDPQQYEDQYLNMISNESVNQYKDYFETENDVFDLELLAVNKHKAAIAFENWVLPKQDRSGYQTLPLPKWNN